MKKDKYVYAQTSAGSLTKVKLIEQVKELLIQNGQLRVDYEDALQARRNAETDAAELEKHVSKLVQEIDAVRAKAASDLAAFEEKSKKEWDIAAQTMASYDAVTTESKAKLEAELASVRANQKSQIAAIESMMADSANLERGQLLAVNEKLRSRLQNAMAFIWDLLEGDVKMPTAGRLQDRPL